MLRKGSYIWLILWVVVCPAIGQASFNLTIEENTLFVEVLEEVSEKYSLNFAYPSAQMSGLSLTPSQFEGKDLEEFLHALCTNAGTEYKLVTPSKVLIRIPLLSESTPSLSQIMNEQYTLAPMKVRFKPVTILAIQSRLMMLNGVHINSQTRDLSGGISGSDLIRNIQQKSGVASFNDRNAEVLIRGSQGDETLIVLDDIPIIKTDHFLGIFSNINDMYVSDIQLYKNALPIEFSGRTGGMVLMQSVDTVSDFKGHLDLSLLTTSAKLQIPLNALSIHFAIRTSTEKVWEYGNHSGQETTFRNDASSISGRNSLIISTIPDFKFHDVNTKFNIRLNETKNLQINLFSSVDEYVLNQFFEFNTLFDQKIYKNQKLYTEYSDWRNKGASVAYRTEINDRWTNKSVAAYSTYKSNNSFSNTLIRERPDKEDLTSRYDNANSYLSHMIKNVSELKISPMHSYTFGGEIRRSETAIGVRKNFPHILQINKEAFEYHLFSSVRYAFVGGKWITDSGLRATYYPETERIYWQPQVSSRYILNDKMTLKSSASRQIQLVNELTHEDAYGRNFTYYTLSNGNNLPIKTSHNFMLGAEFKNDLWALDGEAYYKDIDGKIQHLTSVPGFVSNSPESIGEGYKIIQGSGKVYGLDVSVQFRKDYFTSGLEYTLSKATDTFKAVYKGNPFPAADDRRHQLSWLNTIDVRNVRLNANFNYASGKPYNDLTILMDGLRRDEINPTDFIKKLPPYARIDVGFSKTIKTGMADFEIGAHIYNLTNRQNVYALQNIYSLPTVIENGPEMINTVLGSEVNQLERTFNIQLGIKF